nr:FACT complex subunit SSRP1-like [Ipomoea trifida]
MTSKFSTAVLSVFFLLPKVSQPHTLYPHIVLQFESEYVVDTGLAMNEDLLNAKYKDKLEPTYKGLIHDVFTKILRGLSGAKITGPGKFRSHTQGFAVKSSLKAEDGLLYPLEKGFFFLPKPPTLILYDEIDYVEFERHAAGVIVSSSSGFEESSHSYCPLLQVLLNIISICPFLSLSGVSSYMNLAQISLPIVKLNLVYLIIVQNIVL